MSLDREDGREGFLGRWSRVKRETRAAEAAPPAPVQPEAKQDVQSEPPELTPLEELTFESDYRDFFHPKVGEDVRRGALRKLFSDPHFNVMDGLDVYIDDYSVTEPIPAAMLAGLKQAQRIIEWAAETEEEAVIRRSRPPGAEPEPAEEAEAKTEVEAEPEAEVAAAPPEIAPPEAETSAPKSELKSAVPVGEPRADT